MSPDRFLVRPVDTLFFRDGRPFNQDDEGMADVRSLFPPWPNVLAGAFRASVARARGWKESCGSWASEQWPRRKEFVEALGDGPEMTGATQLRFGPPVVLRKKDDGKWERLYPPPLHLLGKKTPQCWALTFLRLDEGRCFTTDLGETCLPEMTTPVEDAKPLEDYWLTPAGMSAVLAGRRPGPDDIVPQADLWGLEFRVGLQRSSTTRTAEPGMLYAASHMRLRRKIALGVEVEGLPDGWQPQPIAPVGGFQRLAEITELRDGWEEAQAPSEFSGSCYVVVLTSPLPLEGLDGWNRPGGTLGDLPGTIVSACLDRPTMIGGWDGRTPYGGAYGFRGPVPMTPHLPAGSVFFLRAKDEEAAKVEALFNGKTHRIGDCKRQKLGFGECLIGRWPDKDGGKA